MSANNVKDNQNDNKCCTSGCGCGCCTGNQLANFLRHIASYFDKKE